MTREELDVIAAKEQEAAQRVKHRIHVCVAAGCLSSQSDNVEVKGWRANAPSKASVVWVCARRVPLSRSKANM
jgi:hypothetical protein